MVVAASIDSAACINETLPKSVSISRVVVEAVSVMNLKCWFVAKGDNMRLYIASKLLIHPSLVNAVGSAILIECQNENVFMVNRIGKIEFAGRPVLRQQIIAAEHIVPCGYLVTGSNVMISADRVNPDVGVVNRLHYVSPG